jgi:hypothetical protein
MTNKKQTRLKSGGNKLKVDIVASDLMALKVELIQKYSLTYIQATDVVNDIKNFMLENEGIEACEWIEEELNKLNKGE